MKPCISSFSTLILFSVLTLTGFVLSPLLSLQFLPSAQTPSLNIIFSWGETAPQVIEQQVVVLLEGAFNSIEGVKKIHSISGKGRGRIQLDLDKHADLDLLRFEVATKIRQVYPRLPVGISYPKILINNPEKKIEDRPLLVYSISGNVNSSELFRYTNEELSPQLAITKGLESVLVQGGNNLEWRITYNEELMQVLKVNVTDIEESLRQFFSLEALGMAREGKQTIFVNLRNSRRNEEIEGIKWEDIPIIRTKGKTILLGDIAKVELKEQLPRNYYRINGSNSIRLLFFAEKNTNNINLAKRIKENIQYLSTQLPASYELFLDDDSTAYLSEELDKILLRSSLSLGILLLFVLMVYRSWLYLVVILCSLLANLGIAFIFYYWWQIEMHLYALAGITVSFGIIIDNSIVMVHHVRSQNNLKVFPALLAATLTTVSALFVIWFLPELWKTNLLNFAKVIMINLGVSLVVALWLIPALLNKLFLEKQGEDKITFRRKKRILRFNHFYQNFLEGLFRFRKTVIIGIILLFGLPVFLLPNKIDNWIWYNETLGSDYYIENVKPLVNKWLGGTLRLFNNYVYEESSYQEPGESILYIAGSMPNGNTAAQMNAVYQQLETYLDQYSMEIKQYTTTVSSGQYASTCVQFRKGYEDKFPFLLKERLVLFCINLGGLKWNIYGVGKAFNTNAGGTGHRFRAKMLGYNKEELKKQAEYFAEKLLKNPRVREVDIEANMDWWIKDLYQYEMELDKEELANYNINPQSLISTLNAFDQSTFPDTYTPERKTIRFINNQMPENDLWVLKNELLPVDSSFVQFSNIASLEKKKAVTEIHKENQQYLRMVEFEYTGAGRFGLGCMKECMDEMKLEMPLGYTIEKREYSWGEDKEQQSWLVLLIIGFIFFICSIMFESLKQAFVVVLLIPTSFIGIFLTFYWFDFNFDQGGYAAFILLSGIVVNSIIFIINDYNQFRKRFVARSKLSNYLKAFQHKISPILLTIVSTSLGLIPFLIQGEGEVFWFSLAIGTIGGLLFSLVVILFFIPLFVVKRVS